MPYILFYHKILNGKLFGWVVCYSLCAGNCGVIDKFTANILTVDRI